MDARADTPPEDRADAIAPPATLVELLRLRAAAHPARPLYTFLQGGEQEAAHLNYGELDRRARVIAARLQREGARGARALLLYPAGLDFVAAFFGCLYAGVLPVPAYPPRPARPNRLSQRLQALLHDAQPAFALTTEALLDRLRGMRLPSAELQMMHWLATDGTAAESADDWRDPFVRGDDLAFLQYTSGSTSAPKGVMVSHRNLLDNQRHIQAAFSQHADSVIVGWLPLYHDMGLIGNVLQPLYAGARCILMSPAAFMQSPVRWLAAVTRYRATTSGGPDFAYDLCVRKITPEQRATLDLSSWSVAFNGAEPVRPDTLERFAATFAPCGFRRDAWYPCYGLAEATLFVSGGVPSERPLTRTWQASALAAGRAATASPDAPHGARVLVTCGRPPAGQRVVVADPASFRECGPGEVGEIWTAGESVAQGYWNRPSETAETFQAFLADRGAGPFLRTGDLGFVHEGELFVTGRLKDLIIVRGRNHYPQDIERTVEQSHRAFRPGGTSAFSFEHGGEERLVVLQELEPRQRGPDVEALAGAVRRAVAEQHEVNVYDVLLLKAGSLPKTSSGKLQRRACRDAYLAGSLHPLGRDTLDGEAADGFAADAALAAATFDREALLATPAGARQGFLETLLLAQAGHALGIKPARLSLSKSLSAQGLDSLSALELKGRIETTTGVSIPLPRLLDGAGVSDLTADLLDALVNTPQPPGDGASHANPARAATYPLSHGQRALWLLHRLAPASAAYVIANAVRIRTPLDVNALRRALQELMVRHPALRTTFSMRAGEPVQQVHEDSEPYLTITDAAGWNEELLRTTLSSDANSPFDLEHGPVIRAHLYTRAGDDHTLLLAVHHIVADFWSAGVLVRELELLYAAASGGAAAQLEQPAAQFADYVAWQRGLLDSRAGEQLWNFWRKQLAGELPLLDLPTDRPRPPAQSFHGNSISLELGADLTGRLKDLCRAEGVTLYTLLLAAFQVLLFRYTGHQDICVGSPAAGRSRAEFRDVVGYFVNPLVLRACPAGQTPFKTFLADVHRTVLAALDHQDYPFPLLVERLQPARDPSRTPIFQVMFVLQQAAHRDLQSLNALALRVPDLRVEVGTLAFDTVALEQQAAQFDLTLMVGEVADRLCVRADYASELFEAATVERLLGHYKQLLAGAAAAPSARLSELPLLSAAEAQTLLADWNATRVDYGPWASVVTRFEQQVRRTPDSVAVSFGDERLTYAELNRRANRLAHYLRGRGVGPESRVGLLLERSTELVVCVLGVLKAGAAYVPLDVRWPAERLRAVAVDAGLRLVLTGGEATAGATGVEAVRVGEWQLGAGPDACGGLEEGDVRAEVSGGSLAYVIYTSGSTGAPKGAMNTHAGLLNRLLWMQDAYKLVADDVVLQKTPYTFDVSVWEFLWPLMTGARLVVARPGGHQDSSYLVELIAQQQITTLHFVPSMLRVFLQEKNLDSCRSLRRVICSGEALSLDLQRRFFSCLDAELHNLYGPTEASIDVTSWACERWHDYPPQLKGVELKTVPIGRPIANTRIYLLDPRLHPVPAGLIGELYIGGAGVARGYLNRSALTAERFVPDPFSTEPGARLYRTGDVARHLPGGDIEFLGRTDEQVKVRGFRIELGEVEAALLRHGGVREAVVVARETDDGDKRLVAYVVTSTGDNGAPTPSELRQHLRRYLPDYMLPAHFISLPALPLTPNGKVDRKALPAPEQMRGEAGGDYEPPQTPVEELLANIWGELLGVDRVSRADNFFESGGHSLLMAQAAARVRDAFNVELPMTAFFQEPTVAGLALAITQRQAARENADNLNQLLDALEHLSEDELEALLQQPAASDELLPRLRVGEGNGQT